jgi:hypothetical protein
MAFSINTYGWVPEDITKVEYKLKYVVYEWAGQSIFSNGRYDTSGEMLNETVLYYIRITIASRRFFPPLYAHLPLDASHYKFHIPMFVFWYESWSSATTKYPGYLMVREARTAQALYRFDAMLDNGNSALGSAKHASKPPPLTMPVIPPVLY